MHSFLAGYYARAAVLKLLVNQFLGLCGEDTPKQILSLGAGFDTTWFHLKVDFQLPICDHSAAGLVVDVRHNCMT